MTGWQISSQRFRNLDLGCDPLVMVFATKLQRQDHAGVRTLLYDFFVRQSSGVMILLGRSASANAVSSTCFRVRW